MSQKSPVPQAVSFVSQVLKRDIDGQSIADFQASVPNNLYELWNRLSSGSYFPPPVRRVDIPKMDGGTRPFGHSNCR